MIYAQFRSVTGAISETVSVTLNYVTEGPVISNVNVADNQTVSRPLTITADATAILGVMQLELLLDETELTSIPSTSLNYFWDPRNLNDGTYNLTIRATDLAGNVTQVPHDILITLSPPAPPVITSPTNNSIVRRWPKGVS